MKKFYETPLLFEIRFDTEEALAASVTDPDENGGEPEILPPLDIFG